MTVTEGDFDLPYTSYQLFMYNLLHIFVYIQLLRYKKKPKIDQCVQYSFNSIISGFILVCVILGIKYKATGTVQPHSNDIGIVDGYISILMYSFVLYYSIYYTSFESNVSYYWGIINYLFLGTRSIITTLYASYLTTVYKTYSIFISQIIVMILYLIIYIVYNKCCCKSKRNEGKNNKFRKLIRIVYYYAITITLIRSIKMTELGKILVNPLPIIFDGKILIGDIIMVSMILNIILIYNYNYENKALIQNNRIRGGRIEI